MLVPDYDNPEAPPTVKTRMWGTKRATGHDAETQLQGLLDELEDMTNFYNDLCTVQGRAGTTILVMIQFLMGMTSDHAEDQKKLSHLLGLLKKQTWVRKLGEVAISKKNDEELQTLISEVNEHMIADAGGVEAYDMLSEAEQYRRGQEAHEAMIDRFGVEAYEKLKESEAEICGTGATLFVWAGCSMHKDLNAFKYAAKAVSDFWKENGLDPPILLVNKDNAATLAAESTQADAGSAPSAAQVRALEVSVGGAHKTITLAGQMFNHRDNKHGEGDVIRFWFEDILGFLFMFPDVSNTRFGSYGDGAGVLLLHLDLFIKYLEIVRDRKTRPGLNHMEENIYKGLHDIPTLTEMAALALYAQAVSKPYMTMIRGSCKSANMLDMGPQHKRLIAHIKKVSHNPDLLLAKDASPEEGAFDGKWPEPEIVEAVRELLPRLPHLRRVLIACFNGALYGWGRFTTEFLEGSIIASLNDTHKAKIHLPNKNCHNESAFGQMKRKKAVAPNISEHTMTNLLMLRHNNTQSYIKQRLLGRKSQRFLRQRSRMMDASGFERERRKALVLAASKKVEVKRVEIRRKAEAARKRKEELAQRIKETKVTVKKRRIVKFKNSELDRQLDFWRSIDKNVPIKARVMQKVKKIAAIKGAIHRFGASGGDFRDLRPPRKDGEIDSDQSEDDEMAWSDPESDNEHEGGN